MPINTHKNKYYNFFILSQLILRKLFLSTFQILEKYFLKFIISTHLKDSPHPFTIYIVRFSFKYFSFLLKFPSNSPNKPIPI